MPRSETLDAFVRSKELELEELDVRIATLESSVEHARPEAAHARRMREERINAVLGGMSQLPAKLPPVAPAASPAGNTYAKTIRACREASEGIGIRHGELTSRHGELTSRGAVSHPVHHMHPTSRTHADYSHPSLAGHTPRQTRSET